MIEQKVEVGDDNTQEVNEGLENFSSSLNHTEIDYPSVEGIKEVLKLNKVIGLKKAVPWLESYYIKHKNLGTFALIDSESLLELSKFYETYNLHNLAKSVIGQASQILALKSLPFLDSEKSLEFLQVMPLLEKCMEDGLPIRVIFKPISSSNETDIEQNQGVINRIAGQDIDSLAIRIEGQRLHIFVKNIVAIKSPLAGHISWDFSYTRELSQDFIDRFVQDNTSLTEDAKKFLTFQATYNKGPWSYDNNVLWVNQCGRQIIIKGRKSEVFYYLD